MSDNPVIQEVLALRAQLAQRDTEIKRLKAEVVVELEYMLMRHARSQVTGTTIDYSRLRRLREKLGPP